MQFVRFLSAGLLVALLTTGVVPALADGNRLVYLDADDPYYPSHSFAKLVTPQWVGEAGVEAVVVLAIDDMRGHERWEAYLRPILERLKQIDGRAPVSIMTCDLDPAEPHLQTWLKEGVSLETHTADHPCPLLQDGDLAKARDTYERCVDLLASVPGSHPVAFRMPCCDSLNTVSPRFYSEIFSRRTPGGNFLAIDTSVFNILTSNDPELPRELVLLDDGQERFRRYVPFPSYVNTVENYPYPYVIGRLCWQFPCVVPSDWSAQHVQEPRNPRTVSDLQIALDAVVAKRGVYNLVFHPYEWIRNDQIVALIDYAVERHGSKVKFLNFREVLERLNANLLGGQSLRADDGGDHGVRLLDLNGDGYLDVVIGNDTKRETRLWSPESESWTVGEFPVALVEVDGEGTRRDRGVRFGIVREAGYPSLLMQNEREQAAWHFDGERWTEAPELLTGLKLDGQPVFTCDNGVDRGVRLVDLDDDGICELLVANDTQRAVFSWSPDGRGWQQLPFALPDGAMLVDAQGRDQGMRLVDLDDDRMLDLIWSNERGYGVYLFESLDAGWSIETTSASRDDGNSVPPISRHGTNNGAWFHSRHLWVQNEDTARMPDLVARRSFNDLLADSPPRPRSPEASLKALRPRDGFVAELVAAEPLLTDPVAFDWGPDGRLWVAEMGDYPYHRSSSQGRVRVLEDTDGDGRYDKSTVFLDGLRFPNGIKWWKRGVLITSTPDIIYAEDTTGDGQADVREVLYTGFNVGNPQHVVNGFRWGLDNWVYGANGDSGGRVTSVKTGAEVDISGRDFRIRPDEGLIEAQSGYTQFIRARDDWGNWFGNSNSNPLWHYLLEDHYLRRNPHVTTPPGRQDVAQVAGVAPVYPLSRTLERFNDLHTANRFTSACSGMIYRDELLGKSFHGNSFVSEPVHNLVHREIVSPRGLTFTSVRAPDEQRSEFLASTDNWFRPTMLRTGPDGALWVADMYRLVIEHPEWIPPSMREGLDLRSGADRGRIYRIYPVGASLREVPRFDRLSSAELVDVLESPNGWQRDTAHQLLLDRDDAASVVPLLEKMVVEGGRPTARLHALCVLDGLGALRVEVAQQGLRDPHPGVRRHAVRVSEPLLAGAPELGASLTKLVDDPDLHVVQQLAYSLGEWDDSRAGEALGNLAVRYRDDAYITAAVMSSAIPNLDAIVESVLAHSEGNPPADLLGTLLGIADATENTKATIALLPALAGDGQRYHTWQVEALAQLLDMLQRRGSSLTALRDASGEELRSSIERLDGLFDHARDVAADADVDEAERLAAVRLLGRGLQGPEADIVVLRNLLTPQSSQALQQAAMEGLGRLASDEVPELLLEGWKGFGPRTRSGILNILFSRPNWLEACLAALESGQILPHEIDALRRQRLLMHRDESIRQRAEGVFAGAVSTDRRQVIEQYQSVATLTGDGVRGSELFAQKCAVCHKLNGRGHAIGPDLSAMTDKSTDAMLEAILDPNKAVEAKFVSYTAATIDGLIHTGILSSETSTSITLLGQEGKEQVILRSELDVLESSGKSLMPEGLEKDLSPQDVADVIAYLRGSAGRPKEVAGNQPELVRPDALRRELFCLASNCEIYGDTLRLEEVNQALGYWNSENDHAVWLIEIPRATVYDVILEWSCPDDLAGNSYLIEVADQRLTGVVEGTGDWNTFRRETVGQVRLEPGQYRLGIRSNGRIDNILFDLNSVTLRPRRGF